MQGPGEAGIGFTLESWSTEDEVQVLAESSVEASFEGSNVLSAVNYSLKATWKEKVLKVGGVK